MFQVMDHHDKARFTRFLSFSLGTGYEKDSESANCKETELEAIELFSLGYAA
jgi:hypothetical protein